MMKIISDHPARSQPGRLPWMRGHCPRSDLVFVRSTAKGIEVLCLPYRSVDVGKAPKLRVFDSRIEAEQFAKELADIGNGVVRRRIGHEEAVMIGRPVSNVARTRRHQRFAKLALRRVASAVQVTQALARLAALPPDFTDDLFDAPPFPDDAPEILGGE